jgi:hypothetical protein
MHGPKANFLLLMSPIKMAGAAVNRNRGQDIFYTYRSYKEEVNARRAVESLKGFRLQGIPCA